MQVVPEAQLDDLTLARPQLGQDGTDRGPELGLPAIASVARRRVVPAGLATAGPSRGGKQTLALVADHGVQPRAELGTSAKAAQRGGGDDERVLQGLGRRGRVRQ